MRALTKTCLILSLALFAIPAFAQQEPPARVGRVSIVEGALAFYGPGDSDWSAAKVNFPVAENGWFATDPNSRAEFRIGADSAFLANNTEAGFTRLREKDMQLALQQGRIALHLRQLNRASNAEVDIARGGIWLLQRGEYDIDSGDAERPTRIAVFDGSARFVGGGIDITVKAGDALTLSGTDTLSATVEPATVDEFVRWCRAHDYHENRLAAPYHVSSAMTGFEELDTYGVWARAADYGEVWFPRSVPADWAPYRQGHWVWIEPWGWNWVDDEPWGFAPCHYGRWARIHDRWAWVPGEFVPEPVYAPALVAFIPPPAIEVAVPVAVGPPVGWFPLAPGEIYWPSYTRDPTYIRDLNVTNVNVNIVNRITRVAATERTTTPPPVVVNQTFANRSAATIVPATVMTTAADAAPAAIKLPPRALQKAPVSVHPPQIVALPVTITKPAGNAATTPAEGSVKGPAPGEAAVPAAPNAASATPAARSAGHPPVRPNFSQLAPAPQLARAPAQTAPQTTVQTTPAAGTHTAGTPEQHPGQATATIPPAGTHPAGAPQQRPGWAGAAIPPPSTARAGEPQHQPAQGTAEPASGAHPAERQPTQATVGPPAPGRPPGPPDFSHLAPSRGAHPGQPGHATTPATAGSEPTPGLRSTGQPETKTASPGPVQSPRAPQAVPHEAAPPAQAPGLAGKEPANHPGAARTAGEPPPPPNPAAPSPHAASLPAAKQEGAQQRPQQEEILREQTQQRTAVDAAARQQAQQRTAAEAAARQQAQQRAAAEAAAQQKAVAEAAARVQTQQAQQHAAAEAAARAQAQQAQQRAAAEAAARAQAQQAQQHAAAPHACGHPGEPPCPK